VLRPLGRSSSEVIFNYDTTESHTCLSQKQQLFCNTFCNEACHLFYDREPQPIRSVKK
jgi:hypothetical protein